jgi:Fe-Mn family superoxide dismutase
MKNYNQIKNLPFRELSGISSNTVETHYGKLYQGYVKKWQEVQEKIALADKEKANAVFSDLRELKIEETFTANAIILHEAYFDVLGGDGVMTGKILEILERDFGSVEKWLVEFKALCLCSRGWVILAYDFNLGKLVNYVADAHNQGGIWGTAPVLVMDMYEHAYFMDFGADKKSYIETFFKNLNWSAIDGRFQKIAN